MSPAVWEQEFSRKRKKPKTFKASTPMAKEIQLMDQLNERESKLTGVLNRNKSYKMHNSRVLAEMKQEMRNSMDVLVHSMQNEMTAVEDTMKGQMLAAHDQMEDEAKSLRKSLGLYKAMMSTLADNRRQSIPTRRRSVDLMLQQMPKDDVTDSQTPNQFRAEEEWQIPVNQFKNQIARMMDASLEVSPSVEVQKNVDKKRVYPKKRKIIDLNKEQRSLYDSLESVSKRILESVSKANPQKKVHQRAQQSQSPSEDSDDPYVAMDKTNTVQKHMSRMRPKQVAKGEKVGHDSHESTKSAKQVRFALEDPGESSPPSPQIEEEQSVQNANVNQMREVTVDVLCITKGADMHFCELKIPLPSFYTMKNGKKTRYGNRLKGKKVLWGEAPEGKQLLCGVKHQSVVHHKQTNEVYRFGGVLKGKQLRRSEKYNIFSNQWTTLRPDPLARQEALSLVLSDDIIINIGGAAKLLMKSAREQKMVRQWKFFDTLTTYHLESQTWRQYQQSMEKLKHMKKARYGFAGLSMPEKKRVIVFGGNGFKGRMSSVEMYDYGENKWTYLASMPVVKSRHAAVWYGKDAIIAGGDLKSWSKHCYQMDLHRNHWRKLPSLNEERSRPVLQANPEKSCVVAAGDLHDFKSFEILDLRVNNAVWMLSTIESHPGAMEYGAGIIGLS